MNTQTKRFHDLLDVKYSATLFAGVKNPKGKKIDLPYRKFLKKISTLIETDQKDTVLISPCKLSDDYRADKNVIEVNQFAFDIDDPKGLSFDELTDMISSYAGYIHTTHSHRKDNQRYRVVLPLTDPVTRDEWYEARQNFLFFNPGLARIVDPVCKEPSRAYYLWSAPPNQAEHANFFVSMGAPIDPESLFSGLSAVKGKESRIAFEELVKGGITEGSRNECLASYVGGLIHRGLSHDETLARCREWNKTLKPPLDDDELYVTHQSIWGRHLTKPQNSKAPVANQDLKKISSDFQLISASTLLREKPKPREFLIEGFLPKNIVAGLIAAGGVGKSNLTLRVCISVAAGIPLFGKFSVKTPNKVVIVSGEDDKNEISRRLHRITETLDERERQLVGENLHILDLADRFELFTMKPSHGEVEITDVPSHIASVIEREIGTVGLIVIDPAARFRGGEENLAADTTRFVQALQYFRDHFSTAVWLVHHANKGALLNGSSTNNARGSSALVDGLRLVYELNVIGPSELKKLFGEIEGATELLWLRSIKSNYGPACEPISLQRNQDGTLTVFGQSPEDARKKQLLRVIETAGLTKTQIRARYGGVQNALGLSEKALMAAIAGLVAEGLVTAPERGVVTLTKGGLGLIYESIPAGNEGAAV